ncbi:hypothetical protein [Desulfatitalea tepidiphila]|jgi:hypothetical protein|uniref:hypothetical protein n=1 Tax=Desulfatitalea tepidiphila TaxID=1185843 RepID=UPI0006B4F29A|nr:hypothetical protein [Desulfatitalea tepidiphila]
MKSSRTRAQRFTYLFIVGVLAFNYPLLSLFDVPRRVFGVPLLYVYIFVVWALLIVLVGVTARSRSSGM